MSEFMDEAVIRMPFDMAMESELSRKQFYDRANSAFSELIELRQRMAELESQEPSDYVVIGNGISFYRTTLEEAEYQVAALELRGDESPTIQPRYAKPVLADKPAARPAPCENLCEARAFEIEIRQLHAENDQLRQRIADADGQEPVAYMVKVLGTSSVRPPMTVFSTRPNGRRCDFPIGFSMVGAYENTPLYARTIPQVTARITEQDAREAARSYAFYCMSEARGDAGTLEDWIGSPEGRTLLNKLNADREQVPAVAVPEPSERDVYMWFQGSTIVHHIEEDGGHISKRAMFIAKKACEFAMLSASPAPSHSQQSATESVNVWESALIEAAQSVVRANQNNTGYEPSRSLLAYRIDELRKILDDANVDYPGYTDRCPSHDSEQIAEGTPSGYTLVSNELIDFLHGKCAYNGKWFGDAGRGKFWWRDQLPRGGTTDHCPSHESEQTAAQDNER